MTVLGIEPKFVVVLTDSSEGGKKRCDYLPMSTMNSVVVVIFSFLSVGHFRRLLAHRCVAWAKWSLWDKVQEFLGISECCCYLYTGGKTAVVCRCRRRSSSSSETVLKHNPGVSDCLLPTGAMMRRMTSV